MKTAYALALMIAAAAVPVGAQTFSYRLDDGTTEAFLGVAPRVTVLNQFRVEEGKNAINEVNVRFSNDAGIPAQVVLWTDPGGDTLPHDAVPVRIVDTFTSTEMGRDSFSYSLDPVVLETGSVFYVGIYVTLTQSGRRVHGWAPVDLSRDWQRSWVSFGDDVHDLSSAERLDQRYPRLQGSFEIRANAVPEPSTLLLAVGLAALALRSRSSARP